MDKEKEELLHKHQEGTLTEAEYDRYLELLRTDADFYEAVSVQRVVDEVLQEEADTRQWNAIEAALSKKKDKYPIVVSLRENGAWLAAAGLTAIIFGALWWWSTQRAKPTLLSNRTIEIFSVDSLQGGGRAYAGGDLPIGTLAAQWQLNPNQSSELAYTFCRDTLTFSVKSAKDTTRLAAYQLVFDSVSKRLSLRDKQKKTLPLDSCKITPIP
jgi:hypothetical protein